MAQGRLAAAPETLADLIGSAALQAAYGSIGNPLYGENRAAVGGQVLRMKGKQPAQYGALATQLGLNEDPAAALPQTGLEAILKRLYA